MLDIHHTPLVQKRGFDLQSDGSKPDNAEVTSEEAMYGQSAGGSAHARKGVNSFGASMKNNFGASGHFTSLIKSP